LESKRARVEIVRVAAHAAPVFDGWDPIAGTRLF